jgi:hypothetical protein
MKHSGLEISITSLGGFPLMTMRGNIQDYYIMAIEDILGYFVDEGTAHLTLDISNAVFTRQDNIGTLAAALKSASVEMATAVIAAGSALATLRTAEMPPSVTIYSSMDEAVESIRARPRPDAAEQILTQKDDEQLDLAA